MAETGEKVVVAADRVEGDLGALPTAYGPLFGREEDLSRAEQLMTGGDRPVLMIAGPGGVGKTRLAIELGKWIAPGFADGIRFVALAGERTVDEAKGRIRQAIGVGAMSSEQVRSWLELRDLLLILDNFEQISGVGDLVASLAPRTGRSRLVVTSRGPLHIAAEQVLTLGPLGAGPHPSVTGEERGPAVALFVDTARAADAAYAPDAVELDRIGELCRRLDGLPLAIRLAAQRRRLLGVPEMLRRIETDPMLLAATSPDLDDRQRTIQRSIEWSLDLLSDAERIDAHLLSLAPAGWSYESLAAIEPPVPLATLERLLDLGIVGRDRDRLAMLQTVRDIVSVTGTEATRRGNERRLVDAWVRDAGRIAAAGASPDGLAEDANLRLVVQLMERSGEWMTLLRFIGVLDRYWTQSGTAVAIMAPLRRALAVAELPETDDQQLVLALASLASGLAGEPDEGIRWAARLVESVDEHGSAQQRLWARNIMGGAHAMAGHHEAAYETYLAALELERDGADVTKVLVNIAGTAVSLKRDDEAVRFLQEASRRTAASSGVDRHPATLMHLAELATRSSDVTAARGYLVDALRGAVQMHECLWQMGAVVVTSGVALAAGDVETAAMLLARSEGMLERERIGLRVIADAGEIARIDDLRRRLGPERWRELRAIEPDAGLPGLVATALEWLERDDGSATSLLTTREGEIARLIAAGLTNREIADRLFLSPRTVQTHVANMLRKLELPSRSALAAWQATEMADPGRGD